VIICENVNKILGATENRVLKDVNLVINTGEFVSISGRSGSGKSTLLYLISSLDSPTSGTVRIDENNITQMTVEAVHKFRNEKVGFIFQFHFLLPELTALENVLLPARKTDDYESHRPYALALLKELGIEAHADKLPKAMSGGEQQRVAIARAFLMRPRFIFADEPTGNLDTENAEIVMKKLREENLKGTTICLVTHDPDFSKLADREIFLKDGKVISS